MVDQPTREPWGAEVEEATIGGRPYRVYRYRRFHVADFLLDARRWSQRHYLVQGTRRVTFAAFTGVVHGVATRLRADGVEPGTPVMLLGANSPDWVVTFYAILDAGGAVVLGNAWWSEAEVAHALAVAAPALVIADEKRAASLPAGTPVTELRSLVAGAVPASAPPPRPSREDDPAVILFTSGTTGAPKAAVLSHRSVVGNAQNLLVATRRLPPSLPKDHPGTVSLVCVPLFHVGGLQTILSALLTGGTLVFLRGRFDAGEVLRIIGEEGVRVWGAVPTMISRVLDHPDFDGFDTSSLSSITIGGAAVPPALLDRVRTAFPTARGRTGTAYGMTETGGSLTVVAGADMERRPGTVGRALPTVELRIAAPDADGVGEVVARSPTVMDGYLGRPEDPILDRAGWIHTGDLGRIDDEGFLYIQGRCKDIVIRGGENIACPHVENVLATHPAVLEVAVVALPEPEYGEEVAAVVVLRPGAAVTGDELGHFAGAKLGYFEVPTRWWIRREPLPTNATGKVLKKDLLQAWPTAGPTRAEQGAERV